MKKLILDTDIGADCDDAVALDYLLKKTREEECEISAITASTTREFAVAGVRRILDDFGFPSIPVGEYQGEPLSCDNFDHYAKALARGVSIKGENATKLMRKVLVTNDKTDLICIGPLCNIASLLRSESDELSSQTGLELIKHKAGKLYLMGGAFEFLLGETPFAEWNFEQDLVSAKMVLEEFPNEIVICPSETGARVMTYKENTSGFTKEAMDHFFRSIGNPPLRSRPSWDPLTCMVALNESRFRFSSYGIVQVSGEGYTEFVPKDKGRIKYLTLDNDFKKIEKELNDDLENSHKQLKDI